MHRTPPPFRRRIALVGAAIGALVVGVVPPTAAQGNDTIDVVYRNVVSSSVRLGPDGKIAQGAVIKRWETRSADGRTLSKGQSESQAPSAKEGYAAQQVMGPDNECYHESSNQGFIAYPPNYNPVKEKHEKGLFTSFLYTVDNARTTGSRPQPTFQALLCSVGGVDGEGGSRLEMSGPGVFYADENNPAIIGKNWKTGSTPKNYSIELGFEIPVNNAKVGGKITQNPVEKLTGSIRPPYSVDEGRYFLNAANGWWEDGCYPNCHFRFQGSSEYQGSVVEGLWEFPQGERSTALRRGFFFNGYYVHHCAVPFGCR